MAPKDKKLMDEEDDDPKGVKSLVRSLRAGNKDEMKGAKSYEEIEMEDQENAKLAQLLKRLSEK